MRRVRVSLRLIVLVEPFPFHSHTCFWSHALFPSVNFLSVAEAWSEAATSRRGSIDSLFSSRAQSRATTAILQPETASTHSVITVEEAEDERRLELETTPRVQIKVRSKCCIDCKQWNPTAHQRKCIPDTVLPTRQRQNRAYDRSHWERYHGTSKNFYRNCQSGSGMVCTTLSGPFCYDVGSSWSPRHSAHPELCVCKFIFSI